MGCTYLLLFHESVGNQYLQDILDALRGYNAAQTFRSPRMVQQETTVRAIGETAVAAALVERWAGAAECEALLLTDSFLLVRQVLELLEVEHTLLLALGAVQ